MTVVAWVGQRECANCGFTAPETEFMSVGLLDAAGEWAYFVRLDDGDPDRQVVVCRGCACDMEQWSPEFLRASVSALLQDAS